MVDEPWDQLTSTGDAPCPGRPRAPMLVADVAHMAQSAMAGLAAYSDTLVFGMTARGEVEVATQSPLVYSRARAALSATSIRAARNHPRLYVGRYPHRAVPPRPAHRLAARLADAAVLDFWITAAWPLFVVVQLLLQRGVVHADQERVAPSRRCARSAARNTAPRMYRRPSMKISRR